MSKCSRSNCNENAVISVRQPLCKKHFISSFESRVAATIKNYRLISKKDRVVVACSGGKDSTATLYLLNRWFGNVTALAIDEGIPGYRNITLASLKSFCSRNSIPLKVMSYKNAFGFSLQDAIKKVSVLPCNICGTLRRYLLNLGAKGFTKIATGHNLDDEAQSIMMNFLKANLGLAARLGPVTGVIEDKKFVPRVKPLYFCYEKEVAAYAFLQGFGIPFNECPYANVSFRAAVRDLLNGLEQEQPGAKRNIVENFLKLLPRLRKKYSAEASISHCSTCGEPSSNELCKACAYVRSIKQTNRTSLLKSYDK